LEILILGAGQVGTELSELLTNDGHNITIVDTNADRLQKASSQIDLKTVEGNASYPKVLEQADINNIDVAVAMMESDEVNIIACQMIKLLNKDTKTMARIRTYEYLKGKGKQIVEGEQGIDVIISPEELITAQICRLIENPGATQIMDFAKGKVSMVSVKAKEGAPITGHKVAELRQHIPKVDTRIAAIYREDKVIAPKGDDLVETGDEVFFITESRDIKKVISELRMKEIASKTIMIAGGGRIGRRLAESLEGKFDLKIIELNKDRCIYLSEKLGSSLVLNGDSSDSALLEEENIEKTDFFCSVTNDDEANVMSSMLAKKMGAKKSLSLVNKNAYLDLISKEQIDITINPSEITIGSILENLSDETQLKTYSFKRKGEAVELIATSRNGYPGIVGKQIDQIELPKGCVIGAIFSENAIKIAHHDTKINENDHLITFIADKKNLEEVTDIICS